MNHNTTRATTFSFAHIGEYERLIEIISYLITTGSRKLLVYPDKVKVNFIFTPLVISIEKARLHIMRFEAKAIYRELDRKITERGIQNHPK